MPASRMISVPLIGIFLILLMHMMVLGASFLIPVTAAILAYFVLSRPRRALSRIGIPNGIIAFCFTFLILILVAAAALYFTEPVTSMLSDLPELLRDLQSQMVSQQDSPIRAVAEAAEAIDELTSTPDPAAIPPEGDIRAGVAAANGTAPVEAPVQVEVKAQQSSAEMIMSLAPMVLGQTLFAVLLLFFLLQSGDFFLRRTIHSIDRVDDKTRALEIVETIEQRLGRYLGGITLINAGLGVAIGAAMWWWGFERYMALGLMAFALNYIPYLGGMVGATVAALVATSMFDTVWGPIGVFVTYMALTSIEGQMITPFLISRRMQLNAPILFLVVAFFAYIWSVIGMVVAVPILIVAKIVCDEVAVLRNIGHFLGDAHEGKGTRGHTRRQDEDLPEAAPAE